MRMNRPADWRVVVAGTALLALVGAAPAAPAQQDCLAGLAVTADIDGTILVDWPAVANATAYQVVARAGDEAPWTPLAPQVPASASAFTYHPATAGIVYDFVVVPLSGPSQPMGSFCQVSATGRGPDCPAGLAAIRQDDGIHLSWDAVAGADGYNVYRALDAGSFDFIGHVTATSALDAETSQDGTDITDALRQYMVRATLREGESGVCTIATVTKVPFFGTPLAWTAAFAALALAGLVVVRRRP